MGELFSRRRETPLHVYERLRREVLTYKKRYQHVLAAPDMYKNRRQFNSTSSERQELVKKIIEGCIADYTTPFYENRCNSEFENYWENMRNLNEISDLNTEAESMHRAELRRATEETRHQLYKIRRAERQLTAALKLLQEKYNASKQTNIPLLQKRERKEMLKEFLSSLAAFLRAMNLDAEQP